MLVALSETYGKAEGIEVPNWRAFCQLAVEGYRAAKSKHA